MVNFLKTLKNVHDAGIVEKHVVLMVIVYLTDVWELGITHTAGLINIWVGTTKVLPLVFLFLLENYINSYSMLVFSTTTSALGMGLMSMSTPSWPYRLITGSCSEYKMKCVSETQQSFFYWALVLIMIGRSSHEATMKTIDFEGDEIEQEGDEIEQESKRISVTSGSDYEDVQDSVLFLAPWSFIFGFSSVVSSIAFLGLMENPWSRKLYINKPEKSPVTTFLRVFVASISKISQELPCESTDFRQTMEIDDSPLHSSSTLRFLEKAAIRPRTYNARKNRWTLCSLQEVEDTKTLVRMLYIGVVFVILALFSSIGGCYFIQQAKHLKPTVIFGYEVITSSNIFGIYIALKNQFHGVRKNLKNNRSDKNEDKLHYAISEALIHVTMCYLIAGLVEKSRLGVIRIHGISDKPGEIIPMSILWLIPLFLYLGYIDAGLERVSQLFLAEEMPLLTENFKMFMAEAFIGVGHMSSILVVYVIGKVSETGGRLNWFQYYTENSRLDLFYWSLTALSVVVCTIWFKSPYFKNSTFSTATVGC